MQVQTISWHEYSSTEVSILARNPGCTHADPEARVRPKTGAQIVESSCSYRVRSICTVEEMSPDWFASTCPSGAPQAKVVSVVSKKRRDPARMHGVSNSHRDRSLGIQSEFIYPNSLQPGICHCTVPCSSGFAKLTVLQGSVLSLNFSHRAFAANLYIETQQSLPNPQTLDSRCCKFVHLIHTNLCPY